MTGLAPQSRTRPAPLSVRLNADELHALRRLAGGTPLSTYLKQAALEGNARRPGPSASRVRDRNALGRILALLGQSRIAANLRELADAARLGALPVTPQTEAYLVEACGHVREIRARLLEALGQKPVPAEPPAPLAATFADHAGEMRA